MQADIETLQAELAAAVQLVSELREQVASLTAKLAEVEAAPVGAVASV